MTNTATAHRQLAEARGAVCASRYSIKTAKSAQARRTASEDLNFWMGKVSALEGLIAAAEAPMFDVVAELIFADGRLF